MEIVEDDDVIEKSGVKACLTTTVKVVLRVNVPLVPATVRTYVPLVAQEAALIDSVELVDFPAAGVTGFAEKLTPTPAGIPLTINATGEEKVPIEVTVTVTDADPLCATETVAGDTVTMKSEVGPDGVTVNVRAAECDTVPLVPATVSV